MRITVIVLVVIAIVAAGCASPRSAPMAVTAAPDPTSDASLGLSKGSVFETPTPPAVKPNDTAPGEAPVLARPYVIAPPRIPHGITDFLPITPKQNACVDCHSVKEKKAGEPTPLPPSHYTDDRNAPGRVGAELAGARHVCVSCHVPTTDAPNLVGNRFTP